VRRLLRVLLRFLRIGQQLSIGVRVVVVVVVVVVGWLGAFV